MQAQAEGFMAILRAAAWDQHGNAIQQQEKGHLPGSFQSLGHQQDMHMSL